MATHSTVLSSEIPGTEEPGGLVHGITEESDMIERLNNNNNEQFQKENFKTSFEGREILSQKTPSPKPSVRLKQSL